MNLRSTRTLTLLVCLGHSMLGGCAPRGTTDTSAPQAAGSKATAGDAPIAMGSGSVTVVPSEAQLRSRLTPLQFAVTQRGATEPPFQNAYFDNHEAGIYVDVVTGEPLFSSRDKFDSGTGWPSFTRPIHASDVAESTDMTLGMVRTEVVSARGRSHLGHVFDDGPPPTHMRYCINSASLRFVPAARLAAEGYGTYASSFGGAGAADVLPPATSNSCALPPPGETPGCSATLDVAIFARASGDDRVARPDGVLEVNTGREGSAPAVEITFDPSKVTYAALVAAWTKGRAKEALVYTRTAEQKQAATASTIRSADAVPFRRD